MDEQSAAAYRAQSHDSRAAAVWRHRADVTAIGTGVGALGLAIVLIATLPPATREGVAARSVVTSTAAALAGTSTLCGLLLAQRSVWPGRLLVALGGAILVAAPFVAGVTHVGVWVIHLLLGGLMLAAAPLVGPMPDVLPHEERTTPSVHGGPAPDPAPAGGR